MAAAHRASGSHELAQARLCGRADLSRPRRIGIPDLSSGAGAGVKAQAPRERGWLGQGSCCGLIRCEPLDGLRRCEAQHRRQGLASRRSLPAWARPIVPPWLGAGAWLFGKPAPDLPRALLHRIIAYRVQTDAMGDLDAGCAKLLEQLGRSEIDRIPR